jgi:hypothetical protein
VPVGYSRTDDGLVAITMTEEDHFRFIFILGCYMGSHKPPIEDYLSFVNRLNQGNPRWTPYRVEDL